VEGGRINSTKCGDGGKKLVWVGYICAIVAIVFFGSNFVPVKKYDTGDGNSVPLSAGARNKFNLYCIIFFFQVFSSSGCYVSGYGWLV